MEWIVIIEIILKLLENCRQKRSRKSLAGDLNTRGPFERLVLRIGLRREGLSSDDIAVAMGMVDTIQDETDVEAILDAVEDRAKAAGVALAE